MILFFVVIFFAIVYFFAGALTVDYFNNGNGYSAKNDKLINCLPSYRSAIKKRT